MKFQCERCKTRYSIADERVRGKILKIRCKTCSNVIAVREGMPEPEPESPAAAEARRGARPTDFQPAVTGSSPLQSAFAKEMTAKPPAPAALEEEWFVSIEGEQQGPFTLQEAQAWVGAKRGEDELFCWCEGFDDWLPVEKVSHFRGLRGPVVKRTPTGQMPVLARPNATPPPAPEPPPKALFAATLAALEADVAAETAQRKARPDTTPEPAAPPETTASKLRAQLPLPRPPTVTPPPAAASALAAPLPAVKARPTPVTGSPPLRAVGAAPAARFDQSEEPRVREPEPPAPDDDALSNPEPYDGDDGDFSIGEVSRVVKLNDLAAAPRRPATSVTTGGVRRPALGRGTAAVPRVPAAALTDDDAADAAALAPIAHQPRRSHLPLYLLGGFLLVAVTGLAIFLATREDEPETRRTSGGGGPDIEDLGLRQDDPRISRGTATNPFGAGTGTASASGTAAGTSTSKGTSRGTGGKRGTGSASASGTGSATGAASGTSYDPNLEPLTPDDVVTVAGRMSSGTQRCYGQATKKDPFLKVTSIGVLISVNPSGVVNNVTLDAQQGTLLGNCLQGAIARWKFRKSPNGIETKITLKFEQVIGP